MPFDIDTIDIQFDELTGVDGLDLTINAMVSDDNHFLWVGTQGGLIRIDAYGARKWVSSTKENTLINNFVTSLAFDSTKKHLWVGTRKGISVLDLRTESFIAHYSDGPPEIGLNGEFINRVFIDSQQRVWIGSQTGLSMLHNNKVFHFSHSPDNKNSLSNDNIFDIVEDTEGNLWIATQDGLNKFKDNTITRYNPTEQFSSLGNIITSLSIDSENHIWLGTEQLGLILFDTKNNKSQQFLSSQSENSLQSDYILSLLIDDRRRLWVATSQGLSLYNRADNNFIRMSRNDKMNNIVRSVYQDQLGIIWAGTWSSGLFKHNPYQTPLGKVTLDQLKIEDDVIKSLVKGNNDEFWSSNPNYVFRFRPNEKRILKYSINKLNKKAAYVVPVVNYQKNESYILIDRLYKLNDLDNYTTIPLPQKIESLLWYTAYFDRKNRLWLSSRRAGVYVLSPDFKEIIKEIPSTTITYFSQTDESTMLFGGASNIFWVDIDSWKVTTHSTESHQGLKHSNVTGYAKTREGQEWIGTSGGLHKIIRQNNSIKYIPYTTDDGLPTDVITGPLEDNAGQLWLGSVEGLIRFNPSSKTHQQFEKSQGAFSQYYIGQYFTDSDGRLLFQSPDGISIIDQSKIVDSRKPYPVVINDLMLRGEIQAIDNSILSTTMPYNDTLLLPPEHRDFSLFFSTTYHAQPKRVNFFYRLVGFDEYWLKTTADNRKIKYTNIPPGNYRFEIHSVSGSGIMSEIKTVKIMVQAFWYETLLFKITLLLFIAALVFGWHRLRMYRVEKNNRELEKEVERRTQDVKILAMIGQDISSLLDIHDILEHLYFHLSKSIKVEALAIGVCEYNQNRIRFDKSVESGKRLATYYRELNPFNQVAACCVRYNRAIHIKQADERFRYIDEDPKDFVGDLMETVVYLPLKSNQNHVIGCITVQAKEKDAYTDKDMQFIQTIANYTSIALDNTLAYRSLEQAALTDKLTGIYNKRAFINIGSYQIAVAKRSGLPITFVQADIDNLQLINDNSGQACGNMVLTRVASILKRGFRAQDLIARWEGEKFALMFPNTDAIGAQVAIDKMNCQIKDEVFIYKEKEYEINLRFGICELVHQITVEEIMGNAADAIARGKEHNNKKIVVFE